MTRENIEALKTYLLNSIENLNAIKDSKDYAAQAKIWGANGIANQFIGHEQLFEDIFRKNLVNMIAYVKVNMNESELTSNEHYSASFTNSLS